MELKAIKTYIKDLEEDKSCDNITDFGEQILRELDFVVKENESNRFNVKKIEQLFDNNSDCYTVFETSNSVSEEMAMTRGKFTKLVNSLLIDFAEKIEHGMLDNMSSRKIVERFLS